MRALPRDPGALGLDYAGIDFGLCAEGDLLLFEANATMVIAMPDDDARWAYRRGAIDAAMEAVVAMIKRKALAAAARHPEQHRIQFTSPGGRGRNCIVRCNPGEGLRFLVGPEPPHPNCFAIRPLPAGER